MDLIRVYETRTGRLLDTLPASSWSWRRCVSGPGALTVSLDWHESLDGMDLRSLLAPWRTTLAVVDSVDGRVLAAGMVYQRRWDADAWRLEVSCADMWAMLKLRLVMDRRTASWAGGTLTGTDGSYPGPWALTWAGSLSDIARSLVSASLEVGPLPVVLPPVTGGAHTRTYQVPDLATVASRLEEITQVDEGPEIAFQPRLVPGSTALCWHMLTGSPELVSAEHHWDARRRAAPLVEVTVDEDASDMVGDSWARGGSQSDQTLLAHHRDTWLEGAGWPLLQAADTSHSSVSDLATLTAWARSATVLRSRSTEVVQLKARRTDEAGYALGDAVSPGDHLHLRMDDPYLGAGVISLKVLEVGGDEGEWVTVSCRELIDERTL